MSAATTLRKIEPGTVSTAAIRTEEEWRKLRDRALTLLAGRSPAPHHDAEVFAQIVLEYEREARAFKRANEQITELQERLNAELAKDRASRSVVG